MKTATHKFNTEIGSVEVKIDIFDIDKTEAVHVYNQTQFTASGGWRIEGFVNDLPMGTLFVSKGVLGSCYDGVDTEDAARYFLKTARNKGHLSK